MKVAFITSRFPYPLEKGDKLRAYHQIRHLSKQHEIILISIAEKVVAQADLDELRKFCSRVEVFEIPFWTRLLLMLRSIFYGEPMQVGYFFSPAIKAKIHDIILEEDPDHLFCQLIRAAPYVASLPVPKTLDYMDVFSEGMDQRARRANPFIRPLYQWEATKLLDFERAMYREFDFHTIISAQDRDRLPLTYKDKVLILPNGVDTEFFSPEDKKKEYDILFVGNMGYKPNVEAAEYLVREVMPSVWKQDPDCRVCIAGARPSQRVKNLACDKVIITGWMDDIREAYWKSVVFVAPIFSGIGQQNKILEAMSMGMPCITSDMVNNAIGAVHREQIILANDAIEFSKSILSLLGNKELCKTIRKQARQFILDNYSWERQNKKLENLFIEGIIDTSEMHRVK